MIKLLVLDFEGVCTLGAAELVAASRGAVARSLADSIRPECPPIVRAAQTSGVAVVVLSNEISATWATSVPFLAEVDHVIACTDNGILKPDRRAFERVTLMTGVDAESVLVVDDNADNIHVAASLGMHTITFDTTAPTDSWERVGDRLGLVL
ncbi:MAG: HAD-IA family hydrolase [Acidimicrobiales bacterium]